MNSQMFQNKKENKRNDGRRWAEEPKQWTCNMRFLFLLPSSRPSRKMPRLPRLAHKAPVMQANVRESKGLLTWTEENPTTRKILEGGKNFCVVTN